MYKIIGKQQIYFQKARVWPKSKNNSDNYQSQSTLPSLSRRPTKNTDILIQNPLYQFMNPRPLLHPTIHHRYALHLILTFSPDPATTYNQVSHTLDQILYFIPTSNVFYIGSSLPILLLFLLFQLFQPEQPESLLHPSADQSNYEMTFQTRIKARTRHLTNATSSTEPRLSLV